MTTHVFIVDKDTFPVHLKYMFAGTGPKDFDIDFDNPSLVDLHQKKEEMVVGLLADISRVREGDQVIFYLTQKGNQEGKFFGIFKIRDHKPLVFHERNGRYLLNLLNKRLIFRTLIKPVKVYPIGVTEWEALDNIENVDKPKDLIWSLIYRKLKGNRGCTPITDEESEKLIRFIKQKNNNKLLQNPSNLTFDKENQEIVNDSEEPAIYDSLKTKKEPNVFPLMKLRHDQNRSHEIHLQAYITKNAGKNNDSLNEITGTSDRIMWLGNEVSCGVGMQKIDVFPIILMNKEKEFRVTELKSVYATPDIIRQLKRYVDWTILFINDADIEKIQPIVISLKIPNNSGSSKRKYETLERTIFSDFFQALIDAFNQFNRKNNCKPIRFFEYIINEEGIVFEEFNYNGR